MRSRHLYLLFDLGGTLMHARDDWADVHRRADAALVRELTRHHITLDSAVFRERLHAYYAQRDKDFIETTYHFVLDELLRELGYADVAESTLRSALEALFAVTQSNWILEDDTLATISGLHESRHRLGILSNAGDDKDVQQQVQQFGLRPHFDFVLSSAACYYRKPHPRAFELALAQWDVAPGDAVMIGDSLTADIAGAAQLGLKTIWITRRANFMDQDMRQIKPDFSIRRLKELAPTLERLAMKSA